MPKLIAALRKWRFCLLHGALLRGCPVRCKLRAVPGCDASDVLTGRGRAGLFCHLLISRGKAVLLLVLGELAPLLLLLRVQLAIGYT